MRLGVIARGGLRARSTCSYVFLEPTTFLGAGVPTGSLHIHCDGGQHTMAYQEVGY